MNADNGKQRQGGGKENRFSVAVFMRVHQRLPAVAVPFLVPDRSP
jgi:hypothetical protein